MQQLPRGTSLILGAISLIVLGLTTDSLVRADDTSKSTGTGTVQGETGATTTQRGENTGPTTGRNAESGSAIGKVRDPQQSEPGGGESTQRKSTSSHAEKHEKYDQKDTPKDR